MLAQRHGRRHEPGLRAARRAAWRAHEQPGRRDAPPLRRRLHPAGRGRRRRRLGRPGARRGLDARATSYATSSSGSRRSWSPAPGSALPAGPSVDDDPVGAWATQRGRDPGAARRPGERAGSCSPTRTSARCRCPRRSTGSTPPTSSCTPGTWPGPPARTRRSTRRPAGSMYDGMLPMDEMLRASGQYGAPRRRPRGLRPADPAPRVHRPATLTRRPAGGRTTLTRCPRLRAATRYAYLGPAGTFTEQALRSLPGAARGRARARARP